jgi:hypothetical protein
MLFASIWIKTNNWATDGRSILKIVSFASTSLIEIRCGAQFTAGTPNSILLHVMRDNLHVWPFDHFLRNKPVDVTFKPPRKVLEEGGASGEDNVLIEVPPDLN